MCRGQQSFQIHSTGRWAARVHQGTNAQIRQRSYPEPYTVSRDVRRSKNDPSAKPLRLSVNACFDSQETIRSAQMFGRRTNREMQSRITPCLIAVTLGLFCLPSFSGNPFEEYAKEPGDSKVIEKQPTWQESASYWLSDNTPNILQSLVILWIVYRVNRLSRVFEKLVEAWAFSVRERAKSITPQD